MANRQVIRGRNPYYRGAKISAYQFKRILWCFAGDLRPAEAARQVRLSQTSVESLYSRLRRYFVAIGLFADFYDLSRNRVRDAMAEAAFLRFHRNRLSRMFGLPRGEATQAMHRGESFWRFLNVEIIAGGNEEIAHRHMFRDLAAYIRICGPIGGDTQNLGPALEYRRDRLLERIRWLERNSPEFRSQELRTELRRLRTGSNVP